MISTKLHLVFPLLVACNVSGAGTSTESTSDESLVSGQPKLFDGGGRLKVDEWVGEDGSLVNGWLVTSLQSTVDPITGAAVQNVFSFGDTKYDSLCRPGLAEYGGRMRCLPNVGSAGLEDHNYATFSDAACTIQVVNQLNIAPGSKFVASLSWDAAHAFQGRRYFSIGAPYTGPTYSGNSPQNCSPNDYYAPFFTLGAEHPTTDFVAFTRRNAY